MATPSLSTDLALSRLSVEIPAGEVAAADWTPPSVLRLVPAGEFRSRDGRPEGVGAWRLTAALAAGIIARAQAGADDPVIDYEHQTLHAADNGQPAPAAGWWTAAGMQWREGPDPGLYATALTWTPRAKQMLRDKEYRYFSPVIAWDRRTGDVRAVLMGALTNRAAVDGLADLSPTALSALRAGFSLPDLETESMDPAALRKALALPETATDAECLEMIAGLVAAAAKSSAESDALKARLGALTEERDALRVRTAPDLAQYVPRAVHDEALTALRGLATTGQKTALETLITDGLAAGTIPGQQTADWLRAQGLTACRAYLDEAPALAALVRTQTVPGARRTDEQADALSADEVTIAANLGLTVDAYRAAKVQA